MRHTMRTGVLIAALSLAVSAVSACSSSASNGAASTAASVAETEQTAAASAEVEADNTTNADTTADTAASKENDFIVRELSATRDDLNIYGEIYLPGDGSGVYPTVVIGHEYGADHNNVSQYAEMFASSGVAAYIFDFCGGSSTSRSDGSLLEMSVMTEVADMNAVLDMIRAEPFTDPDHLFLMGASQGGLVAALTAAEREADIAALILYYPALVIPDTARAQYSDPDDIPETFNNLGITVGKPYYADILDVDVYGTIGNYTKDVLIIHGDSDSLVPIASSEQALQSYPSAELIPLEGANHVFHGEDAVKAGELTLDFITEHLE